MDILNKFSYKEVLDEIKRRRDSENRGIIFPHSVIHDYIPTIEQSTYYLVGGETGSGKTTFVDDVFLYHPYETYDKVHFVYYSFEISKFSKIVKGVTRKLFLKYGIVVDLNYILSRGKNRISDEIYELCVKEMDYFQPMLDKMDVIDISENPTGINKNLHTIAEKFGTITKQDLQGATSTYKHVEYKKHDPEHYLIVILDHVGLTKRESGLNLKETIDRLSEYIIPLRNKYGFTFVAVQQYSRSIQGADRVQIDRLRPQLSDFKDTGNTQQDANVVFGLFHPHKYGIKTLHGIQIEELGSRVRWNYILKNREGASDINYGLSFIGESGVFNQLPSKIDDEFIRNMRAYKHYSKTK